MSLQQYEATMSVAADPRRLWILRVLKGGGVYVCQSIGELAVLAAPCDIPEDLLILSLEIKCTWLEQGR